MRDPVCHRMGCGNPVDGEAIDRDDLPGCSKHGGKTRVVWSIYMPGPHVWGWLTDNDTIIDWVPDVDDARWFFSKREADEWIAEHEIGPAITVRLK